MNSSERLEKIAALSKGIVDHIGDKKLDIQAIINAANTINLLAVKEEQFLRDNISSIEKDLQALK